MAILLSLAAAGSAQAQAQGLQASYSVRLVGFSFGQATLSGKFGHDAYSINVFARLTGIAQAVSSAKGAAQSSGAIRNGRLVPAGFATTSSNSKETRTVRMGMAGGAVRGIDISPPIRDRPGRIPLNTSHKRGIIDPLSALVFPVKTNAPMSGPSACERTLPVFDGYTRFNIRLRYAGTRNASVRGFTGPVVVCKARYQPLAGHRPHRKATMFMVNNDKMEVWLAPMAKARLFVPFKISVNTLAGMLHIEANRFQISGELPTASVRR